MFKLKYNLIVLLITISFASIAQKNILLLAKIDYQNKNYDLASAEIQKYLSVNSDDKNALLLSAKIYLALKQYKPAIQNLLKLSYKKFPEQNLLLARAYAGINDGENAFIYLNKYLKQRNKIATDEIIAYSEFGNIADSQEWQLLWERNNYSKKELLLLDAKSVFKSGNYEQTENLLNNYIIKYGTQAEVLYMKAQISASHENYRDALSYIDKAIALSDNNIQYLKTRAGIEYHLKKYNKALTDYNFALQKDSLDLPVYFQRAQVYSAMGIHEKALLDIEKYLLYYPNDENVLKRYAEIAYAGKDYLTAIRVYGKLIEKYPGNTEYFKLRANAYMATHTYNYALKDYSMALDLYPRDSEIYYQMGIAYYKTHQAGKACSAWKKAQKYGNEDSKKLIYRYCR